MANQTEMTLFTANLGGNATFTPIIRRLNNTLYFIRSEGRQMAPGGGVQGRRYVGQLVRLDIPVINTVR
jgi:hypothetical protein